MPEITETDVQAVKREYHRQWRATHKENVAAINKRYWERRAAEAKKESHPATENDHEEH